MYGPSCVQFVQGLGVTGETSEDCLTVNVATPQISPAKPLPVMVFIYGGAFNGGASYQYDLQPLSEKGPAVVVSMNYRLGALGFLSLPELDATRDVPSGSDGIRDQQAALRWVHDNIAVFHGDPANVTVFGESAGGTSSCIHLVSPGSQGLANRFLIESGVCNGPGAEVTSAARAQQVGAELVSSLCGGSDAGVSPTDVLGCLRAVDPATLAGWVPPTVPATSSSPGAGSVVGPPFTPTIEGAGGVLPDSPANLIASGAYDKAAAVLAGTNENEWGFFAILQTNPVTTVDGLNQMIAADFGDVATQVQAAYTAPGTVTDANASQVYIDLMTDFIFRCPARRLARSLLAQGSPHVFLYSYDIGPAWHAFELEPIFDFTGVVALGAAVPSPGLTDDMLGYWTRFAATGDPNGGADAGAPAWPAYAAATDQYLEMLDPTPMVISQLRKTQCDVWDSYGP
jgi:para-nitrobenzyl esterase